MKKYLLVCEECLVSNYQIETSNPKDGYNKYCKRCNKKTLHKISR